MSANHVFGYSKSSRAKCHGPPPCHGSVMPLETLRYGSVQNGEYGETIEWRHWGCVTPGILSQLACFPVESVRGFQEVKGADQQKIRLAIMQGKIDPTDIPHTARVHPRADTVGQSNQQKRKALAVTEEKTSLNESGPLKKTTQPTKASQVGNDQTEEVPEPEVRDVLYCVLNTNVVGIQYYTGLVGPGEEVLLVREPQNPYDRNAIQVKNINRIQVGHLPRKVAEKLAPLLDHRAVTLEGVINDGNMSGPRSYTLSIALHIYGAPDVRDTLEPQLVWATPGQRGFPKRSSTSSSSTQAVALSQSRGQPTSSQYRNHAPKTVGPHNILKQQEASRQAAELKQMLNNLEKVDDESRRSSLLDNLCPKEDILKLPVHPNPPGKSNGDLMVDLLKHQSQGLQWCIEREYPVLPSKESDKPVQFWQFKKTTTNKPYYFNLATKTPQEMAPVLGRGALCADAMGLGKTLTMLALILATKNDVPKEFSNTTLIVAPLSVIYNWERQVEEHCVHGALSICIYHGSARSISPEKLAGYDVVITTYQTVVSEHVDGTDAHARKKKKILKSLFDVQWKRIILDEGHTIRNPKTKMAKALCALDAQRRWILTGTPIINSPKDLGSLLTFLRICRPLDDEDFYKRLLLRPLKNGDPSGAELLRALMSHICIRRTKEMQDSTGQPLIPLPPVDMIIIPVTLNKEEQTLYDEIEQLVKERFESFMNRGNNFVVQSNVLGMLTRLRQLVLHPGLVPSNYFQDLGKGENGEEPSCKDVLNLTTDDKGRLQALLARAVEDCEECPICFGVYQEPRITYCGHCFCLACISAAISRDSRCPMDRRPLEITRLLELPPPMDLTQAPYVKAEEEFGTSALFNGSSSKIDQLVHLLRMTPPTEKCLVFSQFTSFLDKIGDVLQAEGIAYLRFDGQMSARRRQQTISQFSIPLENVSTGVNDAEMADESDSDFLDQDALAQRKRKKGKGKIVSSGTKNPRVMLLSLKAGALGLNLTVANNVFLMDPWWQEAIESQAIDRVNRIGQTKPVHVFQLVAEKTVESRVLQIQDRKKKMIEHAFSGMQQTETQRQRREARLQDLKELFDIRQQNAKPLSDII